MPRSKSIPRVVIDTNLVLSALVFAQGSPMISGGDELSRTQDGNNYAYCQDCPPPCRSAATSVFKFIKGCRKVEHKEPYLPCEAIPSQSHGSNFPATSV